MNACSRPAVCAAEAARWSTSATEPGRLEDDPAFVASHLAFGPLVRAAQSSEDAAVNRALGEHEERLDWLSGIPAAGVAGIAAKLALLVQVRLVEMARGPDGILRAELKLLTSALADAVLLMNGPPSDPRPSELRRADRAP